MKISLFSILFGLFINYISKHSGGNFPYIDASKSALAMAGIWMTARKKLGTYWIWFIVNIVSVYLYYLNGRYWFSFKYVVYLFLSIYGGITWYKSYLNQTEKI